MKTNQISRLKQKLRRFADERDWNQFHSPKNLAMALSVEAGELLEIFQWIQEEQSHNLSSQDVKRAKEELADVFLYLIRLSDQLKIDLVAAANKKLAVNARKYPIHKARGTSRKYTDL